MFQLWWMGWFTYEEMIWGTHSQMDNLLGSSVGSIHKCRRLSILCALVDFVPPTVDLLLTDDSMTLAHGLRPMSELLRTVEFFSGLGATSTGLAAAGFQHVCSVEWCPPLASLHGSVHPAVPVVVGDIGALSCLKQVAQLVDSPFSLVDVIC